MNVTFAHHHPDPRFVKRIVGTKRVDGFMEAHEVALECGHTLTAFGSLEHMHGEAFCMICEAEYQERKAAAN